MSREAKILLLRDATDRKTETMNNLIFVNDKVGDNPITNDKLYFLKSFAGEKATLIEITIRVVDG